MDRFKKDKLDNAALDFVKEARVIVRTLVVTTVLTQEITSIRTIIITTPMTTIIRIIIITTPITTTITPMIITNVTTRNFLTQIDSKWKPC